MTLGDLTMNTKVRYLVTAFFVVFGLITAAGIFLLYRSADFSAATQPKKGDQSKIEVNAGANGLKVDVTTAVPGVIVFVFGVAGLILLLVKTPVREILGYTTPRVHRADSTDFMLTTDIFPQPVLGEKVERIPLLVWWFLRNKKMMVKTKPGPDQEWRDVFVMISAVKRNMERAAVEAGDEESSARPSIKWCIGKLDEIERLLTRLCPKTALLSTKRPPQ